MKLDESFLNRRDFLDGMIGTGVLVWTGVAGEMVLSYLTGLNVEEPNQIIVEGKTLERLARDQFILLPYGPLPVLLIRLPHGQLRAFSAVCTHGQCNVRYRPKENDIYCGCHKGRYTADGVNVPGTPPPRPLHPFHIRQRDDGSLLVSRHPPVETSPSVHGPTEWSHQKEG